MSGNIGLMSKMRLRKSMVVVENFYEDPDAVRNYALKQQYYTPYEDQRAVDEGRARPTWWASGFRRHEDCSIKSSKVLISTLEYATGERVDMAHWCADYPVGADFKPTRRAATESTGCLWNCCFHVKPNNRQLLGDGVHNHVTDGWNSVGSEGWAGIVYLNPSAPLDGGLYLWRNRNPAANFDWMTSRDNWLLIDALGNHYNRLLLVRGDIPHSGAGGWGESLANGRMFQTFFFKTFADGSIAQGVGPKV